MRTTSRRQIDGRLPTLGKLSEDPIFAELFCHSLHVRAYSLRTQLVVPIERAVYGRPDRWVNARLAWPIVLLSKPTSPLKVFAVQMLVARIDGNAAQLGA